MGGSRLLTAVPETLRDGRGPEAGYTRCPRWAARSEGRPGLGEEDLATAIEDQCRAHQSAPMARLPILDTHGTLAHEICPDLSRPCCHSMMSMMEIVRTVRVRHAVNSRG
jgi:hypothetical protein